MRPPAGVNLMALVSRFHTTCCRRRASPRTVTRSCSIVVPTSSPFARSVGRTESMAASMIAARSTGDMSKRQLAADDARHVEQVVDQPRLQRRVSLDGLERAIAGARAREHAALEHARPPEDGREGRAQLVRDDPEEVVLHPVAVLELLAADALEGVEPGPFEGLRALLDGRLEERDGLGSHGALRDRTRARWRRSRARE